MKYSKFITNRLASQKTANTKSVGADDSTNTNSDKASNANSNNNVVGKSMHMFEKIITYSITYLLVSFILSGLNPKTIKSSEVIEYENSKIFKEIVKRPDTYINIITEYNLKYLLTKKNCLFFINESKLENTKKHIKKHIKKQMEETEFLLLGFIDILDIKLYLDAKLFNNSNSNGSGNSNGKGNVNYGRLGITKKDIKSYEKLDNIFNENLDTIYKLMIQLDKMCKRQESYSRKANGNNGNGNNKANKANKVNKGNEVMIIINKNSNDYGDYDEYDDLLGEEIDIWNYWINFYKNKI